MQEDFLTISEITNYLHAKFIRDPHLQKVVLLGEISNFRERPGHQYFSLKDTGAVMSALMFAPQFKKVKFKVEEGMSVIVVGNIGLYRPQGKYQITIESMEPYGIGALFQAFEETKARLQKEGLFEERVKQAVPKFPTRIAVITSESGAVIEDIKTTIKRRYPIAELVLFPTVVQGAYSKQSIVDNLRKADEMGNFDTIILGRGGGSFEDLWSFNEEEVVRAIFEAKTPIISSVGHETDTTLADLVADLRAATPTAAAEMATPVLMDELRKISEMK
ncbi:MAG: exodeoxyribonuclease VII large subunit, partial [Streptococcaceae bacterium]|nr:exodeoxyribonuclease VII large subunit [Streptococcaceae bacterium]